MNGEYRPIKKFSIRRLALAVLSAMFFVLMAFAIASCGGSQGGDGATGEYYLSLASENWQTYTSQTDIPEKLHFKQVGNEGNIYTLTVSLDVNEQFTINKLGSDEKFGYSKIFSVSDELTSGVNGSIKVTAKGTYSLTLDVENDLTYEFTADVHIPEIVSVSITSSKASMTVGDSYPFAAEILYEDDTKSGDVTWSSDNETVCTVAGNGMVTALAEGSAKITASAGEFSASVDVTVSSNPVPATGVSLDRTELSLELGESDTLVATVEPQNAINKEVFWDVTNSDIVTVTQEGVITAVGYGNATVTVSTVSGGHSDQCHVTVVKHATAINLDPSNVTVAAGGTVKTVTVSFSPSDATDADFTFDVTSGSENVNVVREGNALKISGLKAGDATLVVSSASNAAVTASCEIRVVGADEPVASMPENLKLMIDGSTTLTATLDNATIKSVAWSVESDEVATVIQGTDKASATVTALKFGSTTITATITDTNEKQYTLTSNLLVADDYFFIYGYGLGAYDWDFEDYISDKNAAAKANVLFDEYSRGVYKLTRHFTTDNGFQIIFPKVAQWSETNPATGKDVWNKNIPSDVVPNTQYYDSSRSTSGSAKLSATAQFGVSANGTYTITLDLTGTSAKVYIERRSVDVTGVSLTQKSGPVMLHPGESLVLAFSCLPATASVSHEDWEISFNSSYADFEQYFTKTIDYEKGEITITAKGDLHELFMLTVTCACKDAEASTEFAICPTDFVEAPVKTIAFEQEHYSFNVNNGGAAWTIPVKANVNADATVQAVKYSIVSDAFVHFKVEETTGVVTATGLGTVTVLATSIADESIRTTCTVTFYSDTFYLVGEFNGLSSFDAAKPNETTLAGDFAEYKFTKITETYYRLEHEFTQAQEIANHGRDNLEYGFQVVFLGMDANWNSRFSFSKASCYNATTYFNTWNAPNIRVNVTGVYILEVDLSGTQPTWCINWKETELQEVKLEASESVLHAGDTAKLTLSTAPRFATIPADTDFEWSIEGNEEGYISGSYDAASMTYSITVQKIPHSGDVTITVRVQLGSLSASVTLTIVPEHHLVQKHTDQEHWWECTDEGCTYEEGKASHEFETTLTNTDPAGHYMKCKDCDYYSELMPHTLTLNEKGRFDFSEDVATCEECGFKFFEVEGGKLIHFYATATKITMPESITEIGDGVFEGHSEITSINLPSALKSIGKNAFKGCSGLIIIQIPDTVTSIGSSAFEGVKAQIVWGANSTLKVLDGFEGYLGQSFVIPSSVMEIEMYAFKGSGITSIDIPDNVYGMGTYVFSDCINLRTAVISKNVKAGHEATFWNCSALEEVYFKSTQLKAIYGRAFNGCTSLSAVYINLGYKNIKNYGSSFITKNGNDAMKGKLYAFAEADPGANVDFGGFSDYFAGTWHFIEGEDETLEHIQVWTSADFTNHLQNVTLFFEDRTKYEA